MEKNKEKYPEKMREHMNIEVIKMIGCGYISLGFVAYICLKCIEVFKMRFTCRSRFFSKCGKKYISEWAEKQVNKILHVPHRHCVFTIPAEYMRLNVIRLKNLTRTLVVLLFYVYCYKVMERVSWILKFDF